MRVDCTKGDICKEQLPEKEVTSGNILKIWRDPDSYHQKWKTQFFFSCIDNLLLKEEKKILVLFLPHKNNETQDKIINIAIL